MLAICAAQWPGIGLDGIFGAEAKYMYPLVFYTFGCQGWYCITVSWRLRKNKPTAKDKRTTARCMRILRLFLRLYVKDQQQGSQSLWKTCLGNRRKDFWQHQERCDMIRNLGGDAASMMLYGMLLNDFSTLSSLLFFVIDASFLYRRHMINLKQQAVIVHCTTQVYRQQYVACQLYRHDFSNDVVSTVKHGIITNYNVCISDIVFQYHSFQPHPLPVTHSIYTKIHPIFSHLAVQR